MLDREIMLAWMALCGLLVLTVGVRQFLTVAPAGIIAWSPSDARKSPAEMPH
jgi:hypothetical protein